MANVGDLYVNFKVNADGLESGLSSLNSFVAGSKRDLNAMNGAVDALSQTLAKLGIDPSIIQRVRDFVAIGTKGLPKMVQGLAAVERRIFDVAESATYAANGLEIVTSVGAIEPLANSFADASGQMQALGTNAVQAGNLLKNAFSVEIPDVSASFGKLDVGTDIVSSLALIDQFENVDIDLSPIQNVTSGIVGAQDEMARFVAVSKEQSSVLGLGDEIARGMRQAQAAATETAISFSDELPMAVELTANQFGALETKAVQTANAIESAFAIDIPDISAAFDGMGADSGVTSSLAIVADVEKQLAAAEAQAAKSGGAITAAIRGIGQFAGTVPDRLRAIGATLSEAFGRGVSRSRELLGSLLENVRNLPSRIGGASSGIAAAFASIPQNFGKAVEAVKTGALAMDRTLTAAATRAVAAGRAIGASLYAALGPIGLILAAGAALYALLDKLASDAERRAEESAARIAASRQRAEEQIGKALDQVKQTRGEIGQVEQSSAYIQQDIDGINALIAAREEEREGIQAQIDKERELRDELKTSKEAQVALAESIQKRERAERSLAGARESLMVAEGQRAGGGGSDEAVAEAQQRVLDAQAVLNAQKAQEAEARKLVDATSELVNREAERIDVQQRYKKQQDELAATKKAEEAITGALKTLEDERLKLTMTASQYEAKILADKLAAAGVKDPAELARVQAAKEINEALKQQNRFQEEQAENANRLIEIGLTKEQADRRAYEARVAEMNLLPAQTSELLKQYDAIQAASAAKTAQQTIGQEMQALEAQLLELTHGKAAAELMAYEAKLRAAGLDNDAIAPLMAQLEALQAMRKEVEKKNKAEQEATKLAEDRARLEEQLQAETEKAKERAAEMEEERQRMTEGVSTAIGEMRIGAVSNAVDVQKTIASDTKKTVEELKKINEKLANAKVPLT